MRPARFAFEMNNGAQTLPALYESLREAFPLSQCGAKKKKKKYWFLLDLSVTIDLENACAVM